jgi:chromosome segregation ATPase
MKWQEQLQLEPTLITSLLPYVDPSTGKLTTRTVDDFFNTKILNPANKYSSALAVLREKAQVAEQTVYQMQQYVADSSKTVSDKITPILKDWAKAKNAFYEMDAKIAAEKEKVRKVLETRIADLTRDKLGLGQLCKKHEDRIASLEGTEKELEACKGNLNKANKEIQAKVDSIAELDLTITELNDEIYQRKTKESELSETIAQLTAVGAGLEQDKLQLQATVAQNVLDLKQVRHELAEMTEERNHFQVRCDALILDQYLQAYCICLNCTAGA